ncbi:MAG TPA: O-methyltransferase [Mycobacteriales bacterium]|nr:O-methyltransferase [Mycobacteriales bacterium]
MTDFAAVDAFLAGLLVRDDPGAPALAASEAAGLPPISVSAVQGKLLHLLVRATGARRVLEVGTLGGYSAVWLASALPDGGELVTLERDPRHAAVATESLAAAGLADRARVVVGPALDSLPGLAGPFDLVFIDADKTGNAAYLDWAARLGRPGTVVVLDNVVRQGAILATDADNNARATVAALELLANDERFDATAIQMVGAKGWDGFALAVLR